MVDDFENYEIISNYNNDLVYLKPRSSMTCNDKYHKAAVEVLDHIKEKFKSSKSRAEQIQLLALASKSWSRRELIVQFKISEQVKLTKKLVAQHGILTLSNKKRNIKILCNLNELYAEFQCEHGGIKIGWSWMLMTLWMTYVMSCSSCVLIIFLFKSNHHSLKVWR